MDKKYKYLTVFLYSISMLTGTFLDTDDENLRELIIGFISNYYYIKKDILNKMFDFKAVKPGEFKVMIDYDKVTKYGSLFLTNPKKLIALYDEIGKEDINEISNLSELFCNYCIVIDNMNKNIKKH